MSTRENCKGKCRSFFTDRFIMKNDDGRITAHDAPRKISLIKFKYGVPFVLIAAKLMKILKSTHFGGTSKVC